MNSDVIDQVLSSRVRVRIANALAVRPRTLGELSWITGISVQGVLRHLKLLMKLGLVEEMKLGVRAPKARRVYVAKSPIGYYSAAGLTVVKATEKVHDRGKRDLRGQSAEAVAGDLLILKRRIREQTRKLGLMIDELADAQATLAQALSDMPLSQEQRLILEVLLTEETLEEGEKVLSRFYGLGDRRSIDKALAQAKRIVK